MERYRVYCGKLSFEGTQNECIEQIEQWYLDGEIDSSDLISGLDDELIDEFFHYFETHSVDL